MSIELVATYFHLLKISCTYLSDHTRRLKQRDEFIFEVNKTQIAVNFLRLEHQK